MLVLLNSSFEIPDWSKILDTKDNSFSVGFLLTNNTVPIRIEYQPFFSSEKLRIVEYAKFAFPLYWLKLFSSKSKFNS